MQNKKLAIVDMGNPALDGNKLFDPNHAARISHTLLPYCHLYEQALQQGIELVTPDVFLAMATKPHHVPLVSHLTGNRTHSLVEAGAVPTVLLCQESPFVATRFYIELRKISSQFKHSVLFSGMRRQASFQTKFHTMYFPQYYAPKPGSVLPFSQKKFMIMVASAKGVNNWKKSLVLKALYGFGVKEVNHFRRKAANYFSSMSGFDLYGFGWDTAQYPELVPQQISRAYRGPLPYDQKIPCLGEYKFNLCFENSIFPGYVTEKIFDAFLAGTVPIYYGAPDIANFVPPAAFIDFRDFGSIEKLSSFLASMPEETYNGYITAAGQYLKSEQYRKFTQEYFSGQMLSMLKEAL